MKKSFLKTVAMVIASVLCVGIFPFSFGCAQTEETPEIYLTVSDNIKNNSFAMGRDYEPRERILTYYYSDSYLYFKTQAFDKYNNKYLGDSYTLFDETAIHLTELGTHVLWQIYPIDEDRVIWFKLTVRVIMVPTVKIQADDTCISSVENVRYVYKYNGEKQYPKFIDVFDPHISTVTPRLTLELMPYIYNIITEGGEEKEVFKDVGVYRFSILIPDTIYGTDDDGVHIDYYDIVRIENIIIKIVE